MSAGVMVQDILRPIIQPLDPRFRQGAGQVHQHVRSHPAQDPPAQPRARHSRSSEERSRKKRKQNASGGDDSNGGDDDPPRDGGLERAEHVARRGGRLLAAKQKLQSGGVFQRRAKNAQERETRVKELIERLDARRSAKSEGQTTKADRYEWCVRNIVQRSQSYFLEYLEQVAYDDFDESMPVAQMPLSQKTGYDPSTVLKEVELALIKRCAHFDRCRNDWTANEIRQPGSIMFRIQAIITRAWTYIAKLDTNLVDIEKVKARLCPEVPDTPPEINVLVDVYLTNLLTTLIYDPAMYSSIGARGRRRGLAPAYSSWLRSIMKNGDLDRARANWESRWDSSRKLPVTSMAELFEDMDRPGGVTLALFSGDDIEHMDLLAIKEVSPEDLCRMGWRCEVNTGDWSTRYWRYERLGCTDKTDGSYREAIFRVSMDGEVLGVLDPENMKSLAFEGVGDRDEVEGLVSGIEGVTI